VVHNNISVQNERPVSGARSTPDPVFDYMVRAGEKRRAALQTFFEAMFAARDIPHNEVWMSDDCNACVSWLPSGARRGAAGFGFLDGFLGVIGFSASID
jgi:hypothetical protein